MDRGTLAKRIQELRQARTPDLTRRQLGEMFGYRGESAYQTVYEWETERRGIPAEFIPTLAEALGVNVCGLYGIDEGHQVAAVGVGAIGAQVARALGVPPERVEVNFYAGEPAPSAYAGGELGQPDAEPPLEPSEAKPPFVGAQATQRLLADFYNGSDQNREDWLAFARLIIDEEEGRSE